MNIISCLLVATALSGSNVVTIGEAKGPVSEDLWGIFFEDIDLALDGGVYAELVRNPSFEDGLGKERELTLEYWDPLGKAEYFLIDKGEGAPDDRHAVCVRGYTGAGVANEGYFGINVVKGRKYGLSVMLRADGTGRDAPAGFDLEVSLEAFGKPTVAKGVLSGITDKWQTYHLELEANASDPQCRLAFRMVGASPVTGQARPVYEMQMDHVSLMPQDAVAGLFRKDLVEKLAALKPSFLRFPGGCWVEGKNMKEAYRWKRTLGDRWARRTQWNCWKYWATNAVGFHEYLVLCEVLGAKPLFCINVGMSHEEIVPMEKMDEFVQDALDCIEYANGPVDSVWGAKRAAAGHPKPFNLTYLEIGNENGGKAYEERYKLMAEAVHAKYPEVKLIFDNWKSTKRVNDPKDLRDDHYYETADVFMSRLAHEYDTKKGDFDIFVGEYAVTKGAGRYGNLRAAIGEAAFMLGLERNADQVKLAAYAPLFANAQHTTWMPNLIYPTNDGCFVNPSWTVQKLFSENRGDETLAVKVETGTFETEVPKAWGKGTDHCVIEKVQASAQKTKDGGTILKLVNCTEEEQAVKVQWGAVGGGSGTAPSTGMCRVTRFTGPDRTSHNTPFAPEALKETVATETVDFNDLRLPPLSLTILVTEKAVSGQAYLFSYFRGEREGLHLAYSFDGLVWTPLKNDGVFLKPEIGKDRLMRDPSICQGPDGTFHLVWTSGWKDRIIGYSRSKDLIHWTEQRALPVMEHEPTARNCWAPELTYNPDDGLFYLYWATTIPGRHTPIPGMETEEDQLNHRIYLTTTKDFKTFSPTKLWFDPGFSAIDSAIVRSPKSKDWIMVVKNENHTPPEKNLRITRTADLAKGFPSAVSPKINAGKEWVEGPSPLAVGDTLYVYYDVYGRGRYGAMRSVDDGKTWTDVSRDLKIPSGARHGTMFPVDSRVVDGLRRLSDAGCRD